MAASKIVQELGTQVELEYLSSQRYLRLSRWCANRSMDGLSCFLQTQAQESITLITLVFNYLKRIDTSPPECNASLQDWRCFSVDELFEQTLLDLRIRLAHLSHLSRLARDIGDFATLAFIQKLFGLYRLERERLLATQKQFERTMKSQSASPLFSLGRLCESV
ncbi:ferritin [Enterobacteriaceae bacterium 4M9]|nr:ferritin [Enterobacteriaceae bacterium 4M9]